MFQGAGVLMKYRINIYMECEDIQIECISVALGMLYLKEGSFYEPTTTGCI